MDDVQLDSKTCAQGSNADLFLNRAKVIDFVECGEKLRLNVACDVQARMFTEDYKEALDDLEQAVAHNPQTKSW